jgi:hypothetical protein
MPAAVQRSMSAAACEISGSGSTGSRVAWPPAPSSAVRRARSGSPLDVSSSAGEGPGPGLVPAASVSRSSATTAACASLLVVRCRLAAGLLA